MGGHRRGEPLVNESYGVFLCKQKGHQCGGLPSFLWLCLWTCAKENIPCPATHLRTIIVFYFGTVTKLIPMRINLFGCLVIKFQDSKTLVIRECR